MQDFETFFRQAARHAPYAYQAQLGRSERWPAILALPTGSGKSLATIVAWAYRRLVLDAGPRRLVYALPMRTLVEQTADVAERVKNNLNRSDEDLRVHILMGGEPRPADDWRRHPEANQIIVGTVDMLLSRALNRGYGESRFAWPISFGLLNSDCVWVMDEVQLMGPARVTSAQLEGLRSKFGVAKPAHTVWVSATVDRAALSTHDHPLDAPDSGSVASDELHLPDADRNGPLRRRLDAPKQLTRLDLTTVRTPDLPRRIAAGVLEHHRPGTRSIVVLNRVDLAQRVKQQLDKLAARSGERVVLLHSRFRPGDRATHFAAALAAPDPQAGTIVVSTQVIEAGVDLSSALLATETAPFSSIVQRLGRCNREGNDEGARVLWLDRGELDARQAAPYDHRDIAATGDVLTKLAADNASLSPAALERLQATDPVPEARETWSVLRARHLIDLFDTTPDLSGFDVDVSRYIRPDDDFTVSVCFRDAPASDERRPERQELVDVPIASLGDRRGWVHDFVTGDPTPVAGRTVRPGMTLMLRADDGGYDPGIGWLPSHRERVEPIELQEGARADAHNLDPYSHAGAWVLLGAHLDDAQREAAALVGALAPLGGNTAVVAAAALHDVGKAHPAFQEMLLASLPEEERAARKHERWAKSATRERHERPSRYVRHELASTLALLAQPGLLPDDLHDLTLYLVLAHHGKLRLTIRATPDEYRGTEDGDRKERTVRGVRTGDDLRQVMTPRGSLQPVTLDLGAIDATDDGPSWTARTCALRDDPDLGPFRLAYLEAIVRIADWRASA